METAITLIICFLIYIFMLWGMTSGAGAGPTNRRADNIGFLIFAGVTYGIAVGGGLLLAALTG